MNLQDYVKFANENPICYLATAEGDQPRVRALQMCFADSTGFYFQTQSVKALCKQLKNNKKVEIIFYAPEPSPNLGKVMRVAGKIEFVDDIAVRRRIFEARPFLKTMGLKGPEDPSMAVFRVYTGEAYFWLRENSMKESQIVRMKF
jgi:uncharacterized pyridoxamine 5'-phosphate oxidase family protein